MTARKYITQTLTGFNCCGEPMPVVMTRDTAPPILCYECKKCGARVKSAEQAKPRVSVEDIFKAEEEMRERHFTRKLAMFLRGFGVET